jgi:hypothetical protein
VTDDDLLYLVRLYSLYVRCPLIASRFLRTTLTDRRTEPLRIVKSVAVYTFRRVQTVFIDSSRRRHLWEKHSDCPITWDTKARLALRDEGAAEATAADRLDACLSVYDDGLLKCEEVGKEREMLALCLDTLYAIASSVNTSSIPVALTTALLDKLKYGSERELLSEAHYVDWVSVITLGSSPGCSWSTQSPPCSDTACRHPCAPAEGGAQSCQC